MTTSVRNPPAQEVAVEPAAGLVRLLRTLRPHRLFLILLLAGLVLRLVTLFAYQPSLLYIDSYRYLNRMSPIDPTSPSPVGYMLFLRAVLAAGELWLVPVLHHLLGLGMATAIYVLGLRAGARRWLASLAAVPVLLDAYQLQIEQNVLSETLFQAMVLVALALLVWRGPTSPAVVAGSGLLLGFASIVRLIGWVLIVPVAIYLLFAAGRRALYRVLMVLLFCASLVIPLVAHMSYYQSWTGEFALTPIGGQLAFARVAPWVDCDRVELPAHETALCPQEPLGQRHSIDRYMWAGDSPAHLYTPPPGMDRQEVFRDFARRAMLAQPLDFTRAVGRDMLKNFAWTKFQGPKDVDVGRWHFKLTYPVYGDIEAIMDRFGASGPSVTLPLARFLRGYQLSVGYVPGTLLGLALGVGLLGAVGVGRAKHSPLRGQCFLWATSGAALVLAPALYEFSWRYMLPGLVLLPLAGVLGVTALTHRDRAAAAALDAVDRAALGEFRESYGNPNLAPIAVVIAAYNEEKALGEVLSAMPSAVSGQRVDTIVVDDGSGDGTASVARAGGAYAVVAPINRGQGAALRLGYHVARSGGARYIATLDADGQYDPQELATVLDPVLRDDADFVTGSRRLGQEETSDRFRRLGVRTYAWLVSRLTGQHITDTSNGLRAMKASVTETVALTQPQYQASELLIGTLAQGYRVAERPTTMRERTAGVSKKGHNLLYGLRYGRVVLSTWLRERARGRRTAPTPARDLRTQTGPEARTSR